MYDPTLEIYIKLRLLVGSLGESTRNNWWSTKFFDNSSELFLSPIFPRSFRLAQYTGVIHAAQIQHDKYIGLGNVFHLFRLPEELEQDLQSVMLVPLDDWFEQVSDQENAIVTLRSIAGEEYVVQEGPQAVGAFEQIYQTSGVKLLAQSYLSAFGLPA